MPEICLAGTGGMMPLKNRWLTSCYIEQEGKAVLIDCGEGTQISLVKSDCKLSRIEIMLITHFHADHVSGIPGFLLSLGNSSRTEPLDIYLPKNKIPIFKGLIGICGRLPFRLNLRELPLDRMHTFTADRIDPMLEITSLPLKHGVDCLGYSLRFVRKQVFLPDKAKELGVPLPYWRVLHSGEAVTLDDGRTVTPDQVTENSRPPIKITYITDTLPFGGIAEFASDSDLFICEGMYGSADKKQSMNEKGHMLMQDACRLAADANAKRLWLTHYSPAEMNPQIYKKTLDKIFHGTVISRDGEKIKI